MRFPALFAFILVAVVQSPLKKSYAQVHTLKEKQKLVCGRWVSVNDPKSEIEISATRWTDYYSRKRLGTSAYYFLHNTDTLVVLSGSDTLVYKIASVDEDNLQLSYFGPGLKNREEWGGVTILDYHKKYPDTTTRQEKLKPGTATDFSGYWADKKNKGRNDFSVDIIKHRGSYTGNYCAIAHNGDKIDCYDDSAEHSFEFNQPTNSTEADVNFKTNFSATTGKVSLKLINDSTLSWKIINAPEGEYYCPENAILVKE